MKHLFRSDEFIHESLYVEKEFYDILNVIRYDDISSKLRSLYKKRADLTFNLLGVPDKSNLIKFSPNKNIEIEIGECFQINTSVINERDVDRIKHIFLDKNPELNKSKKFMDCDFSKHHPKETLFKEIDVLDREIIRRTELGGFYNILLGETKETFVLMQRRDMMVVKTKRPSTGRIGRVVRKVLTDAGIEFKDKDLEIFVNKFKSQVELRGNIEKYIEIVKGDDILKWYHLDNYKSGGGTLNSSCMRYEKCQKYLHIYSKNPDKISMIVLKDPENENKTQARALLWDTDQGDKVVDRIYCVQDYMIELIKTYAKEKGWVTKRRQDSSEDTEYTYPDGNYKWTKYDITLDKVYFEFYPYADTMKWANKEDKVISNHENGGYGYLESTFGAFDDDDDCPVCDGSDEVTCEECDGEGTIECEHCNGHESEACERCDETGEMECTECEDGHIIETCFDCHQGKKECDQCDGSDEDCTECFGNGEMDCEHCEEGIINSSCNNCDGSGKETCEDCDGRGENDCHYCSGDGQQECPTCYGNGTQECPNCN